MIVQTQEQQQPQIIKTINIIIKICTPFTNCISEINNTQEDNAKEIDIVTPMFNLIEYSDYYSITSVSFGNIIEMNHF